RPRAEVPRRQSGGGDAGPLSRPLVESDLRLAALQADAAKFSAGITTQHNLRFLRIVSALGQTLTPKIESGFAYGGAVSGRQIIPARRDSHSGRGHFGIESADTDDDLQHGVGA